jgi:hypothetical protein
VDFFSELRPEISLSRTPNYYFTWFACKFCLEFRPEISFLRTPNYFTSFACGFCSELMPQFVSWGLRLASACKDIITKVHKVAIAWSDMDKCKGVKCALRGPYIADAWQAWLSFVLHVQLGKTKQCVLCHLHMCKAEMMSCKPKGVITYYYCLVIVIEHWSLLSGLCVQQYVPCFKRTFVLCWRSIMHIHEYVWNFHTLKGCWPRIGLVLVCLSLLEVWKQKFQGNSQFLGHWCDVFFPSWEIDDDVLCMMMNLTVAFVLMWSSDVIEQGGSLVNYKKCGDI